MSRGKRTGNRKDDSVFHLVERFRFQDATLDHPVTITPYPLRDNNIPTTIHHPRLLAQHISKLYATGTAADCTLVSRDNQWFPAHRAILTAWSPVFTAMFTVNMAEKVSGVCKMENFDGKAIEAMLKFIYTGTLSGIGEFVEEVLEMAEQYDMPDLNTATQEFMEKDVTVETAAGYFHLANRRGLGVKGKLAGFIGQHQREF